MDASTIVFLVLVAGFVTLIILAARRTASRRPERTVEEAPPEKRRVDRKKKGRKLPAEKVPEKPAVTEPVPEPEEEKKTGLKVDVPPARLLGKGLERTRKEGFVGRLASLFKGEGSFQDLLEQAEEVLLTADIGVSTTATLMDALRTEFKPTGSDVSNQALGFLRERVVATLTGLPHGVPPLDSKDGPAVMMVAGVNGTGKTTTIGKMAHFFSQDGKKVLLAAGDTFRAAGVDQLKVWGRRVGVPVVSGKEGADPASVLFDGAKRAKEEDFDLLIADTAGRLHTDLNLVEELKKVHRVLGKVVPGAPHEVMLVLDATMGQNAIRQADIFTKAIQVTGITLAKLDGTAKGGVILSIAKDMGLPIRFVGVGEGLDDLRPFDAGGFADALFDVAH